MAQHVLSHVSHIGVEHNDWLRGIAFYQDELLILEHRLSALSAKLPSGDSKAEVEHFQNVFLVQKGNLEKLKLDIDQNLEHIKHDAENKAQHLSNSTMAEHDAMRDRYAYLEKTLQEIRHDFARFFVRAQNYVWKK
jgi:hypothetical protein